MGGMPPMANPVRSCASRADARRRSVAPVTAARRARSTRLCPATRQMSGSGPVSPGTTKTSDLTICASSTPRAVAASTAVWVDSSKVTTSSVTPFRAAASRTRWIDGWTGVSGTGRSLASDRPGRTDTGDRDVPAARTA